MAVYSEIIHLPCCSRRFKPRGGRQYVFVVPEIRVWQLRMLCPSVWSCDDTLAAPWASYFGKYKHTLAPEFWGSSGFSGSLSGSLLCDALWCPSECPLWDEVEGGGRKRLVRQGRSAGNHHHPLLDLLFLSPQCSFQSSERKSELKGSSWPQLYQSFKKYLKSHHISLFLDKKIQYN